MWLFLPNNSNSSRNVRRYLLPFGRCRVNRTSDRQTNKQTDGNEGAMKKLECDFFAHSAKEQRRLLFSCCFNKQNREIYVTPEFPCHP